MTTGADAVPARVGALAPFRSRAFTWLWLGVVLSSVGGWAQTVGAQWLFIDDPNAATIVSLVQTAATLPMVLFSLAAGVLSDAFDRRRLLLWVQLYFVVVFGLLAALTWAGQVPPLVLLGFTFAIGTGNAVMVATWQPLITELVPRTQLAPAIRLDMASVNVSRAAGPAIAGLIIATWGVAPVFAFSAACTLCLIGAVLAWRRPQATAGVARERFLPALRTGGRYVRHEPVVRLILVRLAVFVAPATAMWALLPLIANRQLGLGADGYGVLFGALGVGAVTAAFTVGRLSARFSANGVLSVMGLLFAASFAATMVVPGLLAALPLLVLLGYAWTATVAVLNAELQLFLPGWVRARAVAIYMMTFTGAQALFSPAWGLIAQHVSLSVAVWVAAGLVALGGLAGFAWHFPESESLDRDPLAFWDELQLLHQPEPDAGPVQVQVEYTVPPAQFAGWREAMDGMRRSRLRSGATRWEVYRVGERQDTYLEVFTVPSWTEHLSQHEGRLTAEDQAIEQHAFSFVTAPPSAVHLLPATEPPEAVPGSRP